MESQADLSTREHGDEAPSARVAAARPVPERLPTILLVDDDKVICRYFEVILHRSGKYNLEIAHNATAALEILSTGLIDLILTDLKMPEIDGFRFINRLQRERRWRDIPVVMISTEEGTASKVNAFQLGVHDYVSKPVNIVEFVGRLDSILRRETSKRRSAGRCYNLAGDFSGICFSDLINLLSFGQRSGKLAVLTPRAAGSLSFVGGELYDLEFGNLSGVPAFHALMRESSGQFEFTPASAGMHVPERKLTQSCMSLLMDAARILDEGASEVGRDALDETASWKAADPSGEREARLESARPSQALLRVLTNGVEGAFTLGELSLLEAEGLRRFTGPAGRERRFHVLLVADAAQGAAALASLASPLSETQLATALSGGPLCLALQFELAESVLADIILLDSRRPAAMLPDLRLTPSVLFLAPPDGDWLSLGVEATVEVAELISTLHPGSVFVAGNGSVTEAVQEVINASGVPVRCETLAGSLSDPAFDFRDALVACIRSWARLAEVKGAAA